MTASALPGGVLLCLFRLCTSRRTAASIHKPM